MKLLNAVALSTLILGFTSCIDKDDDPEVARRAEEDNKIAGFLAANGIDATKSNSGIYKIQFVAGNTAIPGGADIIHLDYDIRTFDDVVFYSDTAYILQLQNGVYIPEVAGYLTGITESASMLSQGELAGFIIPSHLMFWSSSGTYNDVAIAPYETIRTRMHLKAIRSSEQQRAYENDVILSILEEASLVAESLPDGLYKVLLEEGTGTDFPTDNVNVTVDYKGMLTDSTVFDTGTDVSFGLSQVIDGFKEGIKSMKIDEKAILIIPSHLGYGAVGAIDQSGVASIPSYATIRFEVTLKSF